jgi:DNA-binding IclR family transcriptional regulator
MDRNTINSADDDDETIVSTPPGHEFGGVIKSAKRVLELFEFFAECRRPLSVTDVVHGLHYPQSSASSLLKSLTLLGYLNYDRHKRLFTPTLRVTMFGGWIQDQLFSQSNLSQLLDELHQATGVQAVILGMQNDVYVQYIHLVQSARQPIPWYIKPGSLRPLFRSACGRILLSHKSDSEVQQLLWRVNAEEEPKHQLALGDILRELDRIRREGFAYTEGTVNPLVGVLAVAMPTPPSQPPMVLGIGDGIENLRRNRDSFLRLLHSALIPYRGRGGTSSLSPVTIPPIIGDLASQAEHDSRPQYLRR